MSRKSAFGVSLSVEYLEGRAVPSGTFDLTFNGQTTPADTADGGKGVYTITFGGSMVGSPLASVTDLVIDPFNPSSGPPRGNTLDVDSWSWGDSK